MQCNKVDLGCAPQVLFFYANSDLISHQQICPHNQNISIATQLLARACLLCTPHLLKHALSMFLNYGGSADASALGLTAVLSH